MAIDEGRRYELFGRLEQVLGPAEAATMMEALPPAEEELATKADLAALGAELHQELTSLGTGLRQELGRLEVRSELRMEALEHRLVGVFRGELIAAITAQTRSMVFAMAGITATVSGIAFAAARLTG